MWIVAVPPQYSSGRSRGRSGVPVMEPADLWHRSDLERILPGRMRCTSQPLDAQALHRAHERVAVDAVPVWEWHDPEKWSSAYESQASSRVASFMDAGQVCGLRARRRSEAESEGAQPAANSAGVR